MKCPTCGADNPPGSHFCSECGTTLITQVVQPASLYTQAPSQTQGQGGQTFPTQTANPSTMPQPYPPSVQNQLPYQQVYQPIPPAQSNRTMPLVITIVLTIVGLFSGGFGLIYVLGEWNADTKLGAQLICCLPAILMLIAAAAVYFFAIRQRNRT